MCLKKTNICLVKVIQQTILTFHGQNHITTPQHLRSMGASNCWPHPKHLDNSDQRRIYQKNCGRNSTHLDTAKVSNNYFIIQQKSTTTDTLLYRVDLKHLFVMMAPHVWSQGLIRGKIHYICIGRLGIVDNPRHVRSCNVMDVNKADWWNQEITQSKVTACEDNFAGWLRIQILSETLSNDFRTDSLWDTINMCSASCFILRYNDAPVQEFKKALTYDIRLCHDTVTVSVLPLKRWTARSSIVRFLMLVCLHNFLTRKLTCLVYYRLKKSRRSCGPYLSSCGKFGFLPNFTSDGFRTSGIWTVRHPSRDFQNCLQNLLKRSIIPQMPLPDSRSCQIKLDWTGSESSLHSHLKALLQSLHT